ncbi:conserved protein of unknown function [Tenacibaculum sp. 190130A14a]|uniref:Lipoprotein n=1 Tax=Tenacibaculum polynesiense TaxID=3137857 RepID=A0ABM9PF06_9FLAO
MIKKISLIVFTIFLSLILVSCTDSEELIKEENMLEVKKGFQTEVKSCCGEDGVIIPPPPPPPPGS